MKFLSISIILMLLISMNLKSQIIGIGLEVNEGVLSSKDKEPETTTRPQTYINIKTSSSASPYVLTMLIKHKNKSIETGAGFYNSYNSQLTNTYDPIGKTNSLSTLKHNSNSISLMGGVSKSIILDKNFTINYGFRLWLLYYLKSKSTFNILQTDSFKNTTNSTEDQIYPGYLIVNPVLNVKPTYRLWGPINMGVAIEIGPQLYLRNGPYSDMNQYYQSANNTTQYSGTTGIKSSYQIVMSSKFLFCIIYNLHYKKVVK